MLYMYARFICNSIVTHPWLFATHYVDYIHPRMNELFCCGEPFYKKKKKKKKKNIQIRMWKDCFGKKLYSKEIFFF